MATPGECTAELTAKHLVAWCAAFGTPEVWISEDREHFKNGLSGRLPLRFGSNIDLASQIRTGPTARWSG